MLQSCIAQIEIALRSNHECKGGLFVQQNTFCTSVGPSGAPEILTLIYADDPTFGYWYGHIQKHPQKPMVYVSAVVWSTQLVNAPSVPLMFARFRYWIMDRLEYEPCATQRDGDVYCESSNLIEASNALTIMISEFSLEKRWAYVGSPYEGSATDDRILSIYGMVGAFDENGAYDPPPMLPSLNLVKNHP